MAIEIVDFPIKNGDFPVRYVKLPEGNWVVMFDGKAQVQESRVWARYMGQNCTHALGD